MIKKEEFLKSIPDEANPPKRFSFIAILLSLLLNLIFIFLSSLNTRPKRSITYHVKPTPTVFLDYPVPPQIAKQQQAPAAAAQPCPQQPQVIPQQKQVLDEKKALDYLVKQLISSGNENNGQVSLTAGPDAAGETAPPPMPAEINEQENLQQQFDATSEKQTAIESATATQAKEEKLHNEYKHEQLLENYAVAKSVPKRSAPAIQQKPAPKPTKLIAEKSNAHRDISVKSQQDNKKQLLTLADLTNSFIKQVRNSRSVSYHYEPNKKNGGSASGVNSPTSASANSREFALQMYASKVFTLMQQAAHTLTSMIYAQNDFEANTLLEITIDEKGKLLASRLNPSIGEKDIEAAVQTIVQRVGLFPPIPRHFDTDTITLTFPLNIRGNKGFGRYSLSYAFGGR